MFKKARLVVFVVAVLSLLLISTASAGTGTVLFQGGRNAAYSRVIKLANGNLLAVHAVEYADNNGEIRVYKSTDNGQSFSFVTAFTDGTGYQIGTPDLIEVSSGVVLMAYCLWDDNDFGDGEWLKIARSTNEGDSWSIIATVESPSTWVWEPEFAFASDGSLQVYYSYAKSATGTLDALGKQIIVRRQSTDGGYNWGSRTTALGTPRGNNYGMARVTKCGSTYYMAAEWYDDAGTVMVTTSSDGKTWAQSGLDAMEKSYDGWMFSTPEIVCANSALYGLGLRYMDWVWPWNDENCGAVMLKSTNGGSSWSEVPITVEFDPDSSESNYSPTLLPLDSSTMFMITNRTTNEVRFGTASIP